MKIVHVWDQCNYATNVSTKLKVRGVEFERLPRLPEFGVASKFFSNGSRVASYTYQKWLIASILRLSKTNCIFEVHTPHFYSLFPELANRTIFHAHGSEIRETVIGGQHVETVNEITKFAMKESLATLYSTPELGPIIRKYCENSFWAPHIVNLPSEDFRNAKKNIDFIFPASWDTWKGSQEVLSLIRGLLKTDQGLKFVGMDFGSQKKIAEDLGVKLFATRTRDKFHSLIRRSHTVIGHGYGVLGATDLEAIYLGSSYFPFLPSEEWMEAYNFELTDFPTRDSLFQKQKIDAYYEKNIFDGFLSKVKKIHNHNSIEVRLANTYLQSLS